MTDTASNSDWLDNIKWDADGLVPAIAQDVHTQRVLMVAWMNREALQLQVEQIGGIACHTGRQSCFYRVLKDGEWHTVDAVIKDPADLYKNPKE